jgi:hypothetical protein
MTAAEPDIYSALQSMASALSETCATFHHFVDDAQRREEELRDAHLELANALNRRMDGLHTRLDALEGS